MSMLSFMNLNTLNISYSSLTEYVIYDWNSVYLLNFLRKKEI